MAWGFILLRDGYAPKRVTNTRDDKIGTRDRHSHSRACGSGGLGRSRKTAPLPAIFPGRLLLTNEEEFSAWLSGGASAQELIRPIVAERLRIVQEGFDKEDLRARCEVVARLYAIALVCKAGA